MTKREKRIIDVLNGEDLCKASYKFDVEFDSEDRTYITKRYYTGLVKMYSNADEVSSVKRKYEDLIV